MELTAPFSLSPSLSPSVRGPGAGRPWPTPNSANSVSTRSGRWWFPGRELWGTRFLSPGWRCHREGRCSRIPPDASKEKPTCRQRRGPHPASPIALQTLRCELRAWLREHCHVEGPAGPASEGGAGKGLGADCPGEKARVGGMGSSHLPALLNWRLLQDSRDQFSVGAGLCSHPQPC